MRRPFCNLCGSTDTILLHTSYGPMWKCMGCGATVGCHRNSPENKPLGIFADEEMKKLRILCHERFDYKKNYQKRWNNTNERNGKYRRLANEMGIPVNQCHFAKMDKARLQQALEVLEKWD